MAEATVTIDGKKYNIDQLSKEAKQLLANLQAADMEIQRLRFQAGMAQTARGAYAQALKAEIEKMES